MEPWATAMQSLRRVASTAFRGSKSPAFTQKFPSALVRRQSTFAGGKPPGGSDKAWLFGALAVAAPAGYYLYRKHYTVNKAEPISLPDLSKKYDGAIVLEGLNGSSIKEEKKEPTITLQPSTIKVKYLLIGGGLASFSAMESILAHDDAADILMVTEEAYPPYMRPPLAKELWYNVDKDTSLDEQFDFADWHGEKKPIYFQDISFYDHPHAEAHPGRRAKLLMGRKAVNIDVNNRIVTLHDGTKIVFEKALLATGSSPKKLTDKTDPNALDNISHLRTLADFKRIRRAVDSANHIAIIGGGFIGSELAGCLAAYSEIQRPKNPLKITQIFPEEGNMGLVFPKYLSTWAMKQLRTFGVDIWPSSKISMITRLDDDKVRVDVDTSEGSKSIVVDHVIVAIGAVPNTELALGTPIQIDHSEFSNGGLKVSPELELVPGRVWGAGDLITFYDTSLDIWRRVEHYDNALQSGRVAGRNMAAQSPNDYTTFNTVGIFWSDLGPTVGYEAVGLCDAKLTTVGVWAKAEAKDTPAKTQLDPTDIRTESVGQTSPGSVEPSHPSTDLASRFNDADYRKGLVLYVKDRRIVGMLMFNLFNRTALARSVIRQKMTVDDLQDVVELFNINDK